MKCYSRKISTFDKIILSIKYCTSSIILRKEVPKVNLKHESQSQDQGRDIPFITEMAVFTLETDDSCETGYPFDNSRQISNTF